LGIRARWAASGAISSRFFSARSRAAPWAASVTARAISANPSRSMRGPNFVSITTPSAFTLRAEHQRRYGSAISV
jgi:hypothetical protein